jgi:hypothetical protein
VSDQVPHAYKKQAKLQFCIFYVDMFG